MAGLSWRTPPAAIVTVAAFSVADRLYNGHTYIVLLWQDVLPSKLTATFDHIRHLPLYVNVYSAVKNVELLMQVPSMNNFVQMSPQ